MTPLHDPTAHRLLGALARVQAEGRVPSAVAAVVREGEVVWRGHRGETRGPSAGADPFDVQYRIGSITKTMTAVLVLQAARDGLLALDDPASRWLGDIGYADRTLAQLLAHSSGMQSEPAGAWWERTSGVDWETLVARHDGSGAVFGVGERFHYSNLGYALLGRVVAEVSDAPWWTLVAERLLAPLGMTRTDDLPTGSAAQGFSVHPWTGALLEEPATDTGALAPAGQAWSTLTDLARWAAFLTDGHPDVLGREHLRAAYVPRSGEPDAGLGYAHGLGFQMLPGGSGTLVGHAGSMPGFQAICLTDLRTRTSAVALANSTTGFAGGALAADLITTADRDQPPHPTAWTPPPPPPDAVVEVLGQWYWGNTPLALRWEGDHVSVTSTSKEGTFAVVDGRLVGRSGYHAGETVHVHRDDSGAVTHLEVATFVLTRTPYDARAPIPGG